MDNQFENHNSTTETIESTNKNQVKKVNSLNSAFQRLQQSINVVRSEKPEATTTEKYVDLDMETSTKGPVPLENSQQSPQVAVDYELNDNELDSNLVNEYKEIKQDNVKSEKKYTWLAYLLFFIPLFINRKSSFVRLHVNEALEIFLFDVIAGAAIACGKLIKFPPAQEIIAHGLVLLGIGIIILTTITKVFQIVQVLRGKATQTPWLWKWRMIK